VFTPPATGLHHQPDDLVKLGSFRSKIYYYPTIHVCLPSHLLVILLSEQTPKLISTYYLHYLCFHMSYECYIHSLFRPWRKKTTTGFTKQNCGFQRNSKKHTTLIWHEVISVDGTWAFNAYAGPRQCPQPSSTKQTIHILTKKPMR